MPRHPSYVPVTAEERQLVRHTWSRVTPGKWFTDVEGDGTHLYSIQGYAVYTDLARFRDDGAAELAAQAHNLLPRLFAELDDLRERVRTASRGVRVLGGFGDGSRIDWSVLTDHLHSASMTSRRMEHGAPR